MEAVGLHKEMKKLSEKGKRESNHIPAKSTYPGTRYEKEGDSCGDSYPAHSIPYDVHQAEMRWQGTTGSFGSAKDLREEEHKLMQRGKMAEAIKLDIITAYGLCSDIAAQQPMSVTYADDLKRIADVHATQTEDKSGKRFISPKEATCVKEFVDQQVKVFKRLQKETSEENIQVRWIEHVMKTYESITKQQ